MPWLADLDHKVIWPDFAAHWGNTGPAGMVDAFQTMGPFPIPTINTALLLLSGVTLTISHHALRAGHRAQDRVLAGRHRSCWARSSWASRSTNTCTLTAN